MVLFEMLFVMHDSVHDEKNMKLIHGKKGETPYRSDLWCGCGFTRKALGVETQEPGSSRLTSVEALILWC